jgi:hypothetical protein
LGSLHGWGLPARLRARRATKPVAAGASSIRWNQALQRRRLQPTLRHLLHQRPSRRRLRWSARCRNPIFMSNARGARSLRSTNPSWMLVRSEPGPRTCPNAVARTMASAETAFATESAAPRYGPAAQTTERHVKRKTTAASVLASTGVAGPAHRRRIAIGSAAGSAKIMWCAAATRLSPVLASAWAPLAPC